MWPSLAVLIAEKGGRKYQGQVQGIATSVGATAAVIGLTAGGMLYELFLDSVFIMSSMFLLIIISYIAKIYYQESNSETSET
jgi:hypothetical protein